MSHSLEKQAKEPRYVVSQFGLKGSLILFPDPEAIQVGFENISDSGVCIRLLSDPTPKQKSDLNALINASKLGNLVPIQLIFNDVKIPVNVLNNFDGNKYGMCISGHQKLSTLAEKGRQFFQALADGAVKKGAPPADFVDYATASKPTRSRAAAEPLPGEFSMLPDNHPMAVLVRGKFEAFSKKVIFLRSLWPHLASYYLDVHIPPDGEMKTRLEKDKNFKKETVQRWVQAEFNEFIGDKVKGGGGTIENNFMQAMYSYMLKKNASTITFEEISSIFEGRLPPNLAGIREKFLEYVCNLIEDAVEKRFDEYLVVTDQDQAEAEETRTEEQIIVRLSPEGLMKRLLWPKFLELGELHREEREAGRTWTPKKPGANISGLGWLVVLSLSSYEDFIVNAKGTGIAQEDPSDYFVKVDLAVIYQRSIEARDGKKVKGPFGMYLDTLHPFSRRKLLMSKVINSSEWSRYFILRKTKEQLSKTYGSKAPPLLQFIEERMLTDSWHKSHNVV